MANVDKATRAKYAGLMRPYLEAVLNRIQNERGVASNRPQYVLVVRGVIPRGEKLRRSPGHCRTALKRLLANEFYQAYYLTTRRNVLGESIAWSDWRRLYIAGGLRQLIAELEAAGVVEYREIHNMQGSIGIGGGVNG